MNDNAETLSPSNKNKAILYIIASAFFFALMSFFVRLSGNRIPVVQKSFFRNIVSLFIALVMMYRSHQSLRTDKTSLRYLLLRAIAGTLGIYGNFTAVGHLNLADASILNKLSPFFAVVFSVFLLKERVSKTEWLTLCVAFAGALLVIKPSFSMNSLYALAGLAGGIGAGFAYACVRKLGTRGVGGPVIIAFFSAFSCLVALPFMLFSFVPMSVPELVFLLLAGLSAAGGQLFITAAYSNAPAREISVYDYSQIIFTASLGFLMWGQIPDWLSVTGYCLIIGAAVFKWRYARTRATPA